MQSSQLQVGNYTIHYREMGQGFPLVFLHGFLANSLAWTALASDLSSQYRCILIDLLGFGDSSKPDIPFSIETQVSMVRHLIQSLQLDAYSLIGHSMGGWIATSYALKYQPQELQSLVLLAPAGVKDNQLRLNYLLYLPFFLPGPWVDVPLALLSPLIEAAGLQSELQHLARIRQYFRVRPQATQKALENLFTSDPHAETIDEHLDKIQVPTLVIAGAQDRVIPYTHAKLYARQIPKSELVCLNDAKHDLHISHAPQIAQQFLQWAS